MGKIIINKLKANKKGFTLLELLIVIGLVGMIASFGWIVLFGAGSQQELKNTTLSITALLRDAQERSITQADGQYWGVCFMNPTADRDNYFLFSSPSAPFDCGSLVAVTKMTLKPSLEFQQPSETDGSLAIVFKQINGKLISSDCPNSSIIEVQAIRGQQSESINIFCNGRIEF